MKPEANEMNRAHLDNFSTLQNARLDAAIALSEARLKGSANMDMISSPSNTFLETNSNLTYDHGILSVHDLMALDALGIAPNEILTKTGHNSGDDNEELVDIKLPNSELKISRYREGFTRYLDQPGERNATAIDGDYLKQRLSDRYASSPTHQALASLKDKLASASGIKGGVATEPFDGDKDALATLDFLTTTGIVNTMEAVRKLRNGIDARDVIDQAMESVPEYFGKVDDNDKERSVQWSANGLNFSFSKDKQNGLFRYAVNKDPASLYWEVANQSPMTEIPFIETQCAKEFCRVLDSKGLTFSPALQKEIVRLGEAERFGGVYTQITREIAKWIDDPNRLALSKLVVPFEENISDYLDPEQEQEQEHKARALWFSNEQAADSEAAQAIISLIDQVLTRDPEAEQTSDLPVTNSQIEISNGACFDVFAYYLGAAGSFTKPLSEINEGSNVKLLEKTLGSHTFMTVDPIKFNGINLPKGALFSRAKDGGWAMLRLTPFSFDKPIDQQAFGSEIAKAYLHEESTIAYLGGTSLAHLVKVAR